MNTLGLEMSPLAVSLHCGDDELTVTLQDGRKLSVPLVWFPRLFQATPKDRMTFEFLGNGSGIHWPTLDEDISIPALLAGNPSVEYRGARK